jgi:hypothetical protein
MAGFSLQPEERKDGRPEGIWTPYGPELTAEEEQINVRRAAEGKALIKREAYKIRPLRQKDMAHFRKVATDTKPRWRNNQRVEEPDPDQYNELLYDFLIEDWEGLYEDDEHMLPASCTLENKIILSEKGLDRPNFIVLQASLYANDDEARKTAQRDNFRQAVPVQGRSQESGLPSLPTAV